MAEAAPIAALRTHAGLPGAALIQAEDGRSITFAALAPLVEEVAGRLAGHGIGPGERVALIAPTAIESAVAWFALWRLGAVVCPLDPALTDRAALQRLRPARVMGEAGTEGGLPLLPLPQGVVPAGTAARLPPEPSAEAPAAILSTSGSTGAAKMVLQDHGGYRRSAEAALGFLGLRPGERLLEYRSLAWSSPQILSLVPFLVGGFTLCLARGFSRRSLFRWAAELGVTGIAGVPAVIALMLAAPPPLPELPALRFITASSAPLPEEQRQRFEAAFGVPVLALYGMTEAGWVAGNRRDARRPGTVGQPGPHLSVMLQPPAGEVVLQGPQLALGYLREDGSLAPLRGRPFHTGDLGSMDAEGYLTLHGRLGDVINKGGVKIAPAEVEEAVLRLPAVAEAAACAIPDAIYGEAVACLVVPRGGEALSAEAVMHACREALPAFKCPSVVRVLSALPRGPTGKLRRAELARLLSQG